MSQATWRFRRGVREFGPISTEQLHRAALQGRLRASDEVRLSDGERWVTLSALPGLASIVAGDLAETGPPTVSAPPWPGPPIGVNTASRSSLQRRLPKPIRGIPERRLAVLFIATAGPFLLPDVECYLPRWGIWLGAGAGLLLGLLVHRWAWRAARFGWGLAVSTVVYSMVFGVATVRELGQVSLELTDQRLTWHDAPLWALQGMGRAFQSATSPTNPTNDPGRFITQVGASAASIGVSEELSKLLPAFFAAIVLRRSRPETLFLAALSGIGFGVGEAIWLTLIDSQVQEMSLADAVTRLIGCPMAHAAFTVCGALVLWFLVRVKQHFAPMRGRATLALLGGVGVAAIPHGIYDAAHFNNWSGLAGLVLVMVLWLIHEGGERNDDAGRSAAVPT